MDARVKALLMNAVVRADLKDVENFFLEYDLEFDDSYFDYKLLQAANSKEHHRIFKFLLNEIDCRVFNPNNVKAEETPLHIAMKLNYSNIIKKLLNKGALIFAKDENGDIPLLTGFKNKCFNAVRILLINSKPAYEPKYEDTILYFHIACVMNQICAVTYFLQFKVNLDNPLSLDSAEYSGFNPMQYAAENNYYTLFMKLVCFGGDLSLKNANGFTALHIIYYNSSIENRTQRIKETFENGNHTKFTNAVDNNGLSHFHLCCMINIPRFVQVFIDNGTNVNSSISSNFISECGFTPLHFAVINGCGETVELLLKSGADCNKKDMNGRISLHLANKTSGYWKKPIIKMLLKYKASSTIKDNKECTPIHTEFLEANSENKCIIEMLFSQISTEDNFTDNKGLSLFHIACTLNNTSRVKSFLDSGVEVNSCVTSGIYEGYSALHFAVLYNEINVVKLLLDYNAQVNIIASRTQVTPLHLACEFNYMKFCGEISQYTSKNFKPFPINTNSKSNHTNQLNIIKLLLSHGAHVDAKDYLGLTPLLRTCMIDFNYTNLNSYYSWSSKSKKGEVSKEINIRTNEIVEMLISYKAKVTAYSNKRESILHIISKYSTLKIKDKLMKLIVTEGADVDAIQEGGFTPVHVAVKATNRRMLHFLLKHKANVNIKCENSKFPLQLLFPKSFDDQFRFPFGNETIPIFWALLENSNDVNILVDKNGKTNENMPIFCALLENSNDVNIVVDKNGKTLLHGAINCYNDFIIKKLLDNGADINIEDSQGNLCFSSQLFEWGNQTENLFEIDECVNTFLTVYIHVQKLLALGLYVNEKIQRCCNQLYSKHKATLLKYGAPLGNIDNTFYDCIEELEKMKFIKLDNYTSLYSILLKSRHDLSKHVKNISLIKIMNDRNLIKNFPFYNSLLTLQFRRGLIRSHLIQSNKASLINIIGTDLPDLCLDLIVKNLSNEDIANLKNVITPKTILKRKLNDDTSKQTEPSTKLQKKEDNPRVEN